MKLAIATCSKFPLLAESDVPLIQLFKQHSIHAEPAIWNDTSINWAEFDCILFRSVWDYHLHVNEFGDWLNRIESLGIPMLNPVDTIRKNHNKFYLKELQEMGVEIIPTIFLNKTKQLDLSEVSTRGWQHAVIKPAISGGAFLTKQFTVDDLKAMETEFKAVAVERELLVQPFMPEVISEGEISMLFFNRQYSHAVVKVPKPADFRVQKEHGGITTAFNPGASTISTAGKIIDLIEGDLLYARVDGIIKDGRFMLMELELMEPFLFFDYKNGTMGRFVDEAVKMFRR